MHLGEQLKKLIKKGKKMEKGDLVQCDDWVHNGRFGIIVEIQPERRCRGAYILLDIGIKLIRIENFRMVK